MAAAERGAYDRLRSVALHAHASAAQLALSWATRADDGVLGAFEGNRLVGAANVYPFSLSVPGGERIAAAGLSGVSVLPTHTRRGILTGLMATGFDRARERTEAISCLWASEPGIYGRFGYAVATHGLHWTLARAGGAFRPGAAGGGAVELLDQPDARVLAPVYDALATATPGVIDRTPAWWDRRLHDPEGTLLAAVTDGGYALYRVTGGWSEKGPDHALHAYEVVAPDPAAYARLWRYLLDVDLVDTVSAGHRPVDEPLQWMIESPRLMRRRFGEGMWVRLLDIAAALPARAYGRAGALRLRVHDQRIPANDGTWRLDVADDGTAALERLDPAAGADLELDVAALAAMYLGGTRASDLVRAGRIVELHADAARIADAMFTWSPAPWAVTWF